MTKYKLTDADMQTHNGFSWKLGLEKEAKNGKIDAVAVHDAYKGG